MLGLCNVFTIHIVNGISLKWNDEAEHYRTKFSKCINSYKQIRLSIKRKAITLAKPVNSTQSRSHLPRSDSRPDIHSCLYAHETICSHEAHLYVSSFARCLYDDCVTECYAHTALCTCTLKYVAYGSPINVGTSKLLLLESKPHLRLHIEKKKNKSNACSVLNVE